MTQSKRPRRIVAAIALLPAALLIGCGDENPGPQVDPVVEKLDAGWALFSAGDYTGAIIEFDEAVAMNGGIGDGHNGRGWSYLRLDSLETALDAFNMAVAKGFVGADAQAGRCVILNRFDEYRQCVFAGQAVLAIDSRFELEADITVDVRDVRLSMAQSYFALGEYLEALDQIEAVDSAILLNPNSATFVLELIRAIENLTEALSVF
ncbi:MAG: hypothetical protein ABIK65_03330 [Candidatus Eisenbacteria bacterium]